VKVLPGLPGLPVAVGRMAGPARFLLNAMITKLFVVTKGFRRDHTKKAS